MSDLATTLQAVAGVLASAGAVEIVRRWARRRTADQLRTDLTAQVQALAMDLVRDVRADAEQARRDARIAREYSDQLYRQLTATRREVDAIAAQLRRFHQAVLSENADLESLRRLARSYAPRPNGAASARATPSSSETEGT